MGGYNPFSLFWQRVEKRGYRFIESGLSDLSITRTSFDWGVKLSRGFQ